MRGAVAATVGVRGRHDVCTSINKAPGGHLLFLVIVMAATFGRTVPSDDCSDDGPRLRREEVDGKCIAYFAISSVLLWLIAF